jgi:hypothetical protein
LIVLLFKVGGLRSVGDNVVGDNLSEGNSEVYNPLLALPFLHCHVVFPVNVHSVKVVVKDPVAELMAALFGILAL